MAERDLAERFYGALQFELNRERAAVLGRYGRQLEAAIATCHVLLAQVENGDSAAIEPYREARRTALKAVDDLCFQQEMLNVYDRGRINRLYPIPPALDSRPKITSTNDSLSSGS